MHARPLGSIDLAAAATALSSGRGLAWLDGDGSGELGRRSFLAWDPVEVREAQGGEEALALFDLGAELRDDEGAGIPRWVGYLAYDAAWSLGRTLGLRGASRHARAGLPVARLARYRAVCCVDHALGRATLFGDDACATGDAARALEAALGLRCEARVGAVEREPIDRHLAAIERALDAIAEGEVYQVNLARRLAAPLSGDPLALFLAMRRASLVPLGAYLDLGGARAILSRSMERFLAWDAGARSLETRPIKGTIRRGADEASDAAALVADPKERAEHTMIVDLARNDLGRVAEIGSVEVRELMRVEPYAKLSHLVSTIVARSRPGVSAREILRATFPPASVTGTPKLRAIELIDRLERSARGVYCGAIGHVDRAGGLALSVAIRTAVVHGGTVEYLTGGGIVEASDPSREVAETELKARAFEDALEALGRDASPSEHE